MKKKKSKYYEYDEDKERINKRKFKKDKYKNKLKESKSFNKKFILYYSFLIIIKTIILISFFLIIIKTKNKHKINYINKTDNNININNTNNKIFNNTNKYSKIDVILENRNNNNSEKHNEQKSRKKALDDGFEFIKKCKEGQLFNDKKNFKLNSNPKISAIIPVYNCANTLKAVVRSIQNQKMLDIEIILVNDNSENNTVDIMNKLQKEDPRLVIINNPKKMVTFYSRAIGVNSSKGEYIIDLDCDDMLITEDIFDITYNTAIKGNFDVIAFNSFQSLNIDNKFGYKDVFTNKKKNNYTIYQPELSCFVVSNNCTKHFKDLYIWGKIFKSSIYKTALNLLGYERYSTPMIWNEDLTQLFVIYNLAESYISINQYGYFHKMSGASNSNRLSIQDKTFSDIFFEDVIFDFIKPSFKKISVERLIRLKFRRSIKSLNSKSRELLYKLTNKIINSKDIEQKYKISLIETYKNIFPSLISYNVNNISLI